MVKKNSTTGTTSSNKTNKESKRAGKTAIPIQYFYTFAVPTPINFRTNPNNERKQQAGNRFAGPAKQYVLRRQRGSHLAC